MKTYIVLSPVRDFTGDVAGVHLTKGRYEGPLTLAALAYFQQAGYSVTEPESAPPVEKPPAPDNTGAPARNASKADWVAYATHPDREGLRLTDEAADALNRDQLAEKYLGPRGD